jgi:transposase-like protein
MRNKNEPKTLQEAIVYFDNPDTCLNYLVARRWPNGVICPTCGSSNVSFVGSRRVWQCKTRHAKCQFSVKVGTIFEDSAVSLDKWLCAMWMIANCKNGISSWEIHRAIKVTQKTAWFMLHRIRLAMQSGSLMKMGGSGGAVEVDETYIGGKARNMHRDRRERMIDGRGTAGKIAVMGLLERHPEKASFVRLSTVQNTRREDIQPIIRKNVEPGTSVYTDSHSGYEGLDEYFHEFVNHAETYARGKVHTNGLENFWSLLKRGLRGTYVSVEPFHLFRYLDEQAFRYNNRKEMDDADRFNEIVKRVTDKRVTYDKLTGKEGETTAF